MDKEIEEIRKLEIQIGNQIMTGQEADCSTIEIYDNWIKPRNLLIESQQKELKELRKEKDKLKKKLTPWNKGKRKPLIDGEGKKWCDCSIPKLTSPGDGIHQAYCLKCGNFWFN